MTAPPDTKRHYAWVILGLCFFAILCSQGIRLSFGAFVRPWQEQFDASRGTITLIGSLSFLVYGFSQPFVGRAVDRFGIRRTLSASCVLVAAGLLLSAAVQNPAELAITYGIIASLGFGGASGVSASVAVTYWFTERRGLAFALVEAGFGAGQLVIVPIAIFAIGGFGWQETMIGFAAVLVVVVVPTLARWLRDRPEDLGLDPVGGAPLAAPETKADAVPAASRDDAGRRDAAPAAGFRGLLRSRAFWILAAPFFVCGVTTTGFVDTHLIPLAQDRGLSSGVASLAVALLAFANVTGILASGPLADRVDNRLLLAGLYGTRGVSFVALYFFAGPTALIGFALLFGLVDFSTVAPTQWLAARYVEPRTVGLAFGCLNAAHQLGSAIGAWVPGEIFDSTGSYDRAILASVVILGLASLTCVALPRPTRPGAAAGLPEPAVST